MRGTAVGRRIIVVGRRRYISLPIHRKLDYSPICCAEDVGGWQGRVDMCGATFGLAPYFCRKGGPDAEASEREKRWLDFRFWCKNGEGPPMIPLFPQQVPLSRFPSQPEASQERQGTVRSKSRNCARNHGSTLIFTQKFSVLQRRFVWFKIMFFPLKYPKTTVNPPGTLPAPT
jgi:hypothetical protein